MSPYDVTKLSSVSAARGATHDAARAAAAPVRERATGESTDKGVAVQTEGRISAGQVPVDDQRVSEIRKALRDDSYPIVPAKITDAMIAARLMLSSAQ